MAMDQSTLDRLTAQAGQSSGQSAGGKSGIYISGTADAYTLLEAHMHSGSTSDARFRKDLVDYITNPEHPIRGGSYVNFLMDLFNLKDYMLGLQVCDFVLETAPQNADILGCAIRACGETEQFDRGEAYLARAEEIPKELWTWRLFHYVILFLEMKLTAFPRDNETFRRAIAMADEFIRYLPHDERGYDAKAEILVLRNQRAEAQACLHNAIFNTHPDGDDRKNLVCPRCCVTLLDLLETNGDYRAMIDVCNKGLTYSAKSQPGINIGYLTYRKALAYDAMAHAENFRAPQTISDALKLYQSAYDLNSDSDYRRTIQQRYAILRPYADNAPPLVQRKLYVTEAEAQQD